MIIIKVIIKNIEKNKNSIRQIEKTERFLRYIQKNKYNNMSSHYAIKCEFLLCIFRDKYI